MQTLQQQAESYLGAEIEPSEWDKAKAYAEHKLNGIIKREGDGNGKRRQPCYLAQLIAESVRSDRLSQFTSDLMELDRYASEQMGVKKRTARVIKHEPPQSLYPYCITAI